MTTYSETDIEMMYEEIRTASYPDIFSKTKLIFKDIGVFGYASPFSLHVFINIDEVNKYDWPKDAVRGLLAHELAHQVSYKRRSFIGRMYFIRSYPFSLSRRQAVEREADEIAIEKGYGKDLVQERVYQFRIDDEKRLAGEKKVYLSAETLEEMANQ